MTTYKEVQEDVWAHTDNDAYDKIPRRIIGYLSMYLYYKTLITENYNTDKVYKEAGKILDKLAKKYPNTPTL